MTRRDGVRWALSLVGLSVLLGVNALTPLFAHPLPLAAAWVGCLWLVVRSSPRGVLSLEGLYLVLLGLFHLGTVVPSALGAAPAPSPAWLDSTHLGASLRLFASATIAFTLGVSLDGPPRGDEADTVPARPVLFGTGLLVAMGGAAMVITGASQLGLLGSSYGEFYERALFLDTRMFGFGMILFPVGLLVAAAGASPRQMALLGVLFAVVAAPLFASGFRGPLIVQAAALMTVWVRKSPRVAWRLAAVLAVGLLVAVPAIKMTRTREASLAEALRKARVLDFVLEAGGSLHPLVATHELMQDRSPWMGRSYLMGLARIVPNLSSQRASLDGDLAPSAWVTMHMSPWEYDHGGGLGYSAVAEPYLNFGTAGVLLFFLLGGVLARACDRLLQRGPFAAALGASCFGFFLWTVRNDMAVMFRIVTYAAAIVLAAWLLDRLLRRREAA